MSIFNKLRQSKKAAKEYKEREKQKEAGTSGEPKAAKQPYRHVPTHAGVDAMNGAPSTWRAEDKSKIREHYKRRSLLMTSHSDSVLAMKRNPGAPIGLNSNPHVRRSMSQNDLDTPGPSNRSECSDPQCCNSEGRRRHRASRYNSRDYGIGPSPLSSPPQSKETSPSSSLNHSTCSCTNIEDSPTYIMEKYRHAKYVPQVAQTINTTNHLAHFQTDPNRKVGEAPIIERPPPVVPHSPAATTATSQKQKQPRSFHFMGGNKKRKVDKGKGKEVIAVVTEGVAT